MSKGEVIGRNVNVIFIFSDITLTGMKLHDRQHNLNLTLQHNTQIKPVPSGKFYKGVNPSFRGF